MNMTTGEYVFSGIIGAYAIYRLHCWMFRPRWNWGGSEQATKPTANNSANRTQSALIWLGTIISVAAITGNIYRLYAIGDIDGMHSLIAFVSFMAAAIAIIGIIVALAWRFSP